MNAGHTRSWHTTVLQMSWESRKPRAYSIPAIMSPECGWRWARSLVRQTALFLHTS
jgi:hypothetical protein